jgi:recombinational DNA repair protein RecR
MSSYIMVNGSKMDRDYFEENLQEAKQKTWHLLQSSSIKDHVHCIICTDALPNRQNSAVYKFEDDQYICGFCHDNYLNSRLP